MADTTQQPLDLGALLQSASAEFARGQQTLQNLKNIGASEQTAYESLAQDSLRVGDEKGETVESKAARLDAELATQEKNADFYSALGMDKEGAAKTSIQYAQHFTDSMAQALQLSQSIKERESVGFFDNPIAYLWNQMMIPDEKNALQATTADAELAATGMQKVNQMAQQTAQTEEAYKKNLTLAARDSLVDATKAAIDSKFQQIKIQSFEANAQNLARVMAAGKSQIDILHTAVAAKQSAEQLELSRAANARAQEQFKVWQDETKDTEDYFTKMAAFVNAGAAVSGRPPLDPGDVKRALKGKSNAAMLQDVQLLADIGYRNAGAAPGSTVQLSATPADAFLTANNLRIAKPEGINTLQTLASDKVREVLRTNPALEKDKVALANEFNKQIKGVVDSQMANVDFRDGNNKYVVPSTKVMASSDAVQKTKLFQQVLQQEITVGKLDTTDPSVILSKGLAAVKAGKMTLGQLSEDIVTYYRTGVQINNQQQQFAKYGLPMQSSYNANFKVLSELAAKPDSIGGLLTSLNPFSTTATTTKDLTDPTQVNQLLVRMYKADTGTTPKE